MDERVKRICEVCGSNSGFTQFEDGFFYCDSCNSQADDIFDTGVDEEQFFNHYLPSGNRARPIAAEPISQLKASHPNIFVDDMGDDDDVLNGPRDFGSSRKSFSYEDYHSEIRSRYVTGLQIMIQLQCQALVEKFNVSPLIIGLVGPIWLRFLASTRIMANDWADRAVKDSETQIQGDVKEFQPSAKSRDDPVNIYGKRVVYVWYRSLKNAMPIPCSLAISFLVCHVAREAILPSDILKWILEGKLPYFAAFSEIDKQLGSHSEACPFPASRMFRPSHAISSQKLESMAANIAKKIGLDLPPVNFYPIASRYCQKLSLPDKDILPVASQICEWSMPSELYLSSNDFRIPTRAFVMSILIVAIRILFDINGYGMWESSLVSPACSPSRAENEETTTKDADASDNQDSKSTVIKLLRLLEAKYNELDDVPAYSSDLLSYLQHCKDVVFSGLQPSYEEETLLKNLWEFYQKQKPAVTVENERVNEKRSSAECRQEESKKTKERESMSHPQNCGISHDGNDQTDCGMDGDNSSYCGEESIPDNRPANDSAKDKAIKQLMLEMEENKFCYVPPRSRVKRKDYLHYARRRRHVNIYAVHADYYILLRSCAKVAQVEARIMHIAVLTLERRLEWLEKRIDSLLHLKPSLDSVCDLCGSEAAGNDPMDLTC